MLFYKLRLYTNEYYGTELTFLWQAGGTLPDNLWSKISRIQSLGGMAELKSKYEELEASAQRARSTIDNIRLSMQREERLDDQFRARFPAYNGSPSSVLDADIKDNVARFLEAYETARRHDAMVLSDLESASFIEASSALTQTKSQIEARLPKPSPDVVSLLDDTASRSSSLTDTRLLEKLLVDLASVLDRRDEQVKVLEALAASDMSEDLLSCHLGGKDLDNAVSTYLQKVEPISQALQNLQKTQEELLEQIQNENRVFEESREQDALAAERLAVLKTLEQCSTTYFALHAQLSAGNTFYSNLQVVSW